VLHLKTRKHLSRLLPTLMVEEGIISFLRLQV
jgi:hypothetical protein